MIADVSPEKQPAMAASMNVRMSLELRQELQDVADELGVDVSAVARTAISLGLMKTRSAIEDAIDEAAEASLADAVRSRGQSKKRS